MYIHTLTNSSARMPPVSTYCDDTSVPIVMTCMAVSHMCMRVFPLAATYIIMRVLVYQLHRQDAPRSTFIYHAFIHK